MKKKFLPILIVVAIVVIALLWGIGVRNKLVQGEENVTQAWAQVENVYKRRADLIPQLVATVQGAANYEKSTMTEVIEARAKAGSVQVDANNLTEANVAEFQRAQDQLSSALTRSMNIVVERYPELTATQGFRDLQVQLEGTENRIANGVYQNVGITMTQQSQFVFQFDATHPQFPIGNQLVNIISHSDSNHNS